MKNSRQRKYAFQYEEGCRVLVQKKTGKDLQWAETALLGCQGATSFLFTSLQLHQIYCIAYRQSLIVLPSDWHQRKHVQGQLQQEASFSGWLIRNIPSFCSQSLEGCILVCFIKTGDRFYFTTQVTNMSDDFRVVSRGLNDMTSKDVQRRTNSDAHLE